MKLFKLLSLLMLFSLAACSSKKERISKDLTGLYDWYTITYNNEERRIIVDYDYEDTVYFHFADVDSVEERKEVYTTLTLEFGHFDGNLFFDYLGFYDENDDGYDDVQFMFYDDNENMIRATYQYDPDKEEYYAIYYISQEQ